MRFTLKNLFTATAVIGVLTAFISGAPAVLAGLFLLLVPALDLIEGALAPRSECEDGFK